jgi:tagaturonate reductase
VRVLPTIIEYIALKKKLPENLITSFAALICFYKGEWNGETIPLKDSADVISIMQDAWQERSAANTVTKILSNTALWDSDLTKVEGLADATTLEVNHLLTAVATNSR